MHVHNYQMHNVLNVYTRRLEKGQAADAQRSTPPPKTEDRITLSSEGRRQSVMEKVVADIVDKISHYDYASKAETPNPGADPSARKPPNDPAEAGTGRFVYNRIDQQNRKSTTDLPLENAWRVNQRPGESDGSARNE